jgi:hypothetical protein
MRNAFACILACIAFSAHADIYRCEDLQGRVRFTDDARACEVARRVVVEQAQEPGCNGLENCSPPASPSPAARAIERPRDLSSHFLTAIELGPNWEIVKEAAEPIDPALRRRGLTATQARHYTRTIGRLSEVCSVELWQFGQARAAMSAAKTMELPHWQVLRADALLILTRGVRMKVGARTDTRLLDICAELGRRTYERAAR